MPAIASCIETYRIFLNIFALRSECVKACFPTVTSKSSSDRFGPTGRKLLEMSGGTPNAIVRVHSPDPSDGGFFTTADKVAVVAVLVGAGLCLLHTVVQPVRVDAGKCPGYL